MAIDFARINQGLGSKGFENASGLIGAFLQSKGQSDRSDKQNAQGNALAKAQLGQNANHFATELSARLGESRRGEELQRAIASMNTTKLGENENFATRNRLLSTLIPNMRNASMQAPDAAVAAATPQARGFLPEGGLPPELLAALSERGTANAIANRSKQLMNIDPNAPGPDFNAMGFAEGTDTFGLDGYRQQLVDERGAANQSQDDFIQRALMQDYEGINAIPDALPEDEKKKRGGFLGALGSILKIGGPIAASLIPGLGPIASMALAGGTAAGGSLLEGNSIGDALMGGGMAAGGAYGARRLPQTQNRPPGWGVLAPR